jgi:hypothetical protein
LTSSVVGTRISIAENSPFSFSAFGAAATSSFSSFLSSSTFFVALSDFLILVDFFSATLSSFLIVSDISSYY